MGTLTPSGEQPYNLPALQSSEVTGSQLSVTIHMYVTFDGIGQKMVDIQMPVQTATVLAGKLDGAIKRALA